MTKSMKILEQYKKLLNTAVTEFKSVVESGNILYSQSGEPLKLRLYMCDDSFMDIYLSTKRKYSYHWDRRSITKEIYRHDNAPHNKWKHISTFPKHFHNGSEEKVESSYISDDPEFALKEFLNFVMKCIVIKK